MSVQALFLLMIVGWSSLLSVSGSVKAQNIATSEAVAAPNDGETHLGPAQQLAKAILRNDLDGEMLKAKFKAIDLLNIANSMV